jgi:putrescine transport system permease protein
MHARIAALIGGYAFLYVPIIVVVVYSFNESRLVTVWAGFSTHWYGALLQNQQLLAAAWLSVRIAAANATLAVCLGTCAALLVAHARRGLVRLLLVAVIAMLLVVPEVILGFALLLTFVSMDQWLGWPQGRGAWTITMAHVTFSIAFAAIIVRARLATLDPALEEAARDLGASPARVLTTITLPLLTPALAAAWLLAFTLSLDDLVIASFTSGPGSTTLPMVIYSSIRLGVSPQINALATIMIGVVAVGVIIATGIIVRRGRRSNAPRTR